MILLLFVVAGLAVGLVRGGSLRSLAIHDIRALWLPVAAYLCKAASPVLAGFFPVLSGAMPLAGCFLHYGLLFLFVALNLRHGIWAPIFGLGAALNFSVIALNGGAMPVSAHVLHRAESGLAARLAAGEVFAYAAAGPDTRLAFLGDVLALEPFGILLGYASIGDIVLGAGVAMLCQRLVCSPSRTGAKKA